MYDLLFDSASNAGRKLNLDRYFNQNVFAGKQFICPFFKQCRDSHPDIFYHGQLHHVGNHYDLSVSGKPFRVMIVGQEYGHGPNCVTMEERSQMVLEHSGLELTFPKRNPHMRGTTSVLRMLFGLSLGTDHRDEYIQSADGDRFHLFDAFSLVDYLLCSAVIADKGRCGKSTPVMRTNCMFHFKKALEILEPTIVIIQGKSYWKSIQKAFLNLSEIRTNLYTAEINQQKAMIAVFTHPSTPDNEHNWGRDAKTHYLLETVVPTIDIIHQELLAQSHA